MIIDYTLAKECENSEVWYTCYKCGQRIDWSGAGDQTKRECEQE